MEQKERKKFKLYLIGNLFVTPGSIYITSRGSLYYKFLYIPPGMRYDGVGMKGMARSERRNSEWIAILLPCVMNIWNSCCAVSNKNCALLCFALK